MEGTAFHGAPGTLVHNVPRVLQADSFPSSHLNLSEVHSSTKGTKHFGLFNHLPDELQLEILSLAAQQECNTRMKSKADFQQRARWRITWKKFRLVCWKWEVIAGRELRQHVVFDGDVSKCDNLPRWLHERPDTASWNSQSVKFRCKGKAAGSSTSRMFRGALQDLRGLRRGDFDFSRLVGTPDSEADLPLSIASVASIDFDSDISLSLAVSPRFAVTDLTTPSGLGWTVKDYKFRNSCIINAGENVLYSTPLPHFHQSLLNASAKTLTTLTLSFSNFHGLDTDTFSQLLPRLVHLKALHFRDHAPGNLHFSIAALPSLHTLSFDKVLASDLHQLLGNKRLPTLLALKTLEVNLVGRSAERVENGRWAIADTIHSVLSDRVGEVGKILPSLRKIVLDYGVLDERLKEICEAEGIRLD
ncbi:hypothetical protein P7C70_g1531, partial [Phenoliferia sp. Uapishka_3]